MIKERGRRLLRAGKKGMWGRGLLSSHSDGVTGVSLRFTCRRGTSLVRGLFWGVLGGAFSRSHVFQLLFFIGEGDVPLGCGIFEFGSFV